MESASVTALLHLLDNVRISLSQRQVLMPPRVRFHQQHNIEVDSVHQPQQFIHSAISDGDIFCDIERETDKRGQDKHTNRRF